MNKIIIVVRGGIVQATYINNRIPRLDIQIFDIDNELEKNGRSFVDKAERFIMDEYISVPYRSLVTVKNDPIHQQAIEDIQQLKDHNLEG